VTLSPSRRAIGPIAAFTASGELLRLREALDGVDPQLRSHLGIALNTGLTETELRDLAAVLGERVGPTPAERIGEGLARQK
jgi:alkylhydroperoxidase/carboxymuconolactone decarboxylase family protein YurZ